MPAVRKAVQRSRPITGRFAGLINEGGDIEKALRPQKVPVARFAKTAGQAQGLMQVRHRFRPTHLEVARAALRAEIDSAATRIASLT